MNRDQVQRVLNSTQKGRWSSSSACFPTPAPKQQRSRPSSATLRRAPSLGRFSWQEHSSTQDAPADIKWDTKHPRQDTKESGTDTSGDREEPGPDQRQSTWWNNVAAQRLSTSRRACIAAGLLATGVIAAGHPFAQSASKTTTKATAEQTNATSAIQRILSFRTLRTRSANSISHCVVYAGHEADNWQTPRVKKPPPPLPPQQPKQPQAKLPPPIKHSAPEPPAVPWPPVKTAPRQPPPSVWDPSSSPFSAKGHPFSSSSSSSGQAPGRAIPKDSPYPRFYVAPKTGLQYVPNKDPWVYKPKLPCTGGDKSSKPSRPQFFQMDEDNPIADADEEGAHSRENPPAPPGIPVTAELLQEGEMQRAKLESWLSDDAPRPESPSAEKHCKIVIDDAVDILHRELSHMPLEPWQDMLDWMRDMPACRESAPLFTSAMLAIHLQASSARMQRSLANSYTQENHADYAGNKNQQ